jgi:thiamine kinase-like enzyme
VTSERASRMTSSHEREDLTSVEGLSIAKKFFIKEWPSVTSDQVSVTRIKNGWVNRVYIVERNIDESQDSSSLIEPKKILIKMYGGNVTDMDAEQGCELSREEELLVCQEWAKTGLGPKLYGVFPEGRVEEFIESHMMTRNDCLTDPSVRRDMSKILAKFHSLDLPICKEPYDFVTILDTMVHNFRRSIEDKFRANKILQKEGIDTSLIASYDYESDIKWIRTAMKAEYHRIVFIHWDTHAGNVLIRNSPKEGESKVVLIDLQQACYNFRGKDLGLHLTSLMIDFTKPSKEVLDFPPESYYIPLFQEYLDEVEKLGFLGRDFDRKSLENPRHLLFESLVGGVISVLYFLLGLVNGHEHYVSTAPEYAVGIITLFECAKKCKQKLEEEFPEYHP